MKPSSIVLTLANPCEEPWEAMTQAGCGRHCASCNKTVVDFTGWNDADLAAFFTKPENRSTCGRLLHSQTARPIAVPHQPSGRLYRWVAAAGIAVITLTAASVGAQPAFPRAPLAAQAKGVDTAQPAPLGSETTISGTVTDQKGEPLVNATIRLLKNGRQIGGTVTDIDGTFSFETIPETQPNSLPQLETSYIGYASQTVAVPPNGRCTVTLIRAAPSSDRQAVIIRTGGIGVRLLTDPSRTTLSSEQLEHMR